MSDPWSAFLPAVAFGFALGIAPGPVQVLILSESAKRGLAGGIRVMLGANLMTLVILVVLALGLSAATPSATALRALSVVGGLALVVFAGLEIRSIARDGAGAIPAPRRLGPTLTGIGSVLLNPGAWLFFATTASAVLAAASEEGGRGGALMVAVAMVIGVSAADLVSTGLGTGGHRFLGERGLRWLRLILAAVLIAIGVAFVVRGFTGDV